MIAHARGRYIRVSPMRLRQVIDMIRGKDIPSSIAILTHLEKGSTRFVKKVLESAVSNAKLKGLTEEQLFISKITADKGPSWKRFRAASFGRASEILKHTTHLNIELDLKTK